MSRAAKRAAPYHHGSLREAMLRAAETILERDGIGGLTLRAAAREAGVSQQGGRGKKIKQGQNGDADSKIYNHHRT
jgi:hypothetical protein